MEGGEPSQVRAGNSEHHRAHDVGNVLPRSTLYVPTEDDVKTEHQMPENRFGQQQTRMELPQHDLHHASPEMSLDETRSVRIASEVPNIAAQAINFASTPSTCTPISTALVSTVVAADTAVRSLNEATLSLRSTTSDLCRTISAQIFVLLQDKKTAFDRMTQAGALHGALSNLIPDLTDAGAAISRMNSAQTELFDAFSFSASTLGTLMESITPLLDKDDPNLNALGVISSPTNAGPRNSLPRTFNTPHNDMTSTARLQIQKEPYSWSGRGNLHNQPTNDFQREWSIMPHNSYGFSYGGILRPDGRNFQFDDRNRIADAQMLLGVRNTVQATGLKALPGSDLGAYPQVRECLICFDKVKRGEYCLLSCTCLYCHACTNRSLRTSLTTRAMYPPKCLCNGEINTRDRTIVLEKDTLDLLKSVPEEWVTQNPTFCGQERCGAFIPAERFKSKDFTSRLLGACTACKNITCFKCKQTEGAHDGLCGKCPRKTVSPEIYNFAKENMLTKCPGCGHLAELEEGCNEVECICGTCFCFDCGSENMRCHCRELGGRNVDDGYYFDPELHSWTTSAHGLEAEVEFRSWPDHGKVIHTTPIDTDEDDEGTGCEHLRAIAADGKARCHGCLKIFDALKRCFECQIELCVVCRPQRPNYDVDVDVDVDV